MTRIVYITFLLFAFVVGCSRSEKESAYLKRLEDEGPIKEAFDVQFIFSEMAVIQAELIAPHAIEKKEEEQEVRIFDKGLHLKFFTPEGEKKSDLTSEHGKFKQQFQHA
ncbi:MAG: hypothetical protein AAF570_25800, partial [Bacteroidota bacterium]